MLFLQLKINIQKELPGTNWSLDNFEMRKKISLKAVGWVGEGRVWGSWSLLQEACGDACGSDLEPVAITPRADWKQRNAQVVSHCSFSVKDLCIKSLYFVMYLRIDGRCHFRTVHVILSKAVENVCDGAGAKNVPVFFEGVGDAVPAPSLLQNFIC